MVRLPNEQVTASQSIRQEFNIVDRSSTAESNQREELRRLFKSCPIPEHEMPAHLGLFVNRQLLSRFLWMHEMYTKIISVPGVVMEFGVRWGQNLALFEFASGNIRTIQLHEESHWV